MLASTKIIKSTAKTVLKENGIAAIGAASVLVAVQIIVLFCTSAFGLVAGDIAAVLLFAALEFFITMPLFLGVLSFFRRMQWGQTDKASSLFLMFSSKKSYKRALRFNFLLFSRIFVIGIVLFIPYFAARLITSSEFYSTVGIDMPLWAAGLEAAPFFLRAIADMLLIIVFFRYYLAPFLFVADENMDPAEAMHTARIIARRTSYDFFALILSLLPFILLSLLIAPLIFTIPLLIMAYLVHCRFAVTQYNSVLSGLNNDTPFYSANF